MSRSLIQLTITTTDKIHQRLPADSIKSTQNLLHATMNDGRGKHWKAKVEQGEAPTPWKSTRDWVSKRQSMEEEFTELAQQIKQPVELPWKVKKIQLGNTNKTLWMYLKMCSWTDVVKIKEEPGTGLIGITEVIISKNKVDEFNMGPFPIFTYKAGATREEDDQRYTSLHHWRVAGFVMDEAEDDGFVMRFDLEIRDRVRERSTKAKRVRRAADKAAEEETGKKAESKPSLAATTQVKSVAELRVESKPSLAATTQVKSVAELRARLQARILQIGGGTPLPAEDADDGCEGKKRKREELKAKTTQDDASVEGGDPPAQVVMFVPVYLPVLIARPMGE